MRTIGRYVLHAPIASGGMGTVYLGRVVGAAGFARTVAVKSMLASTASDEEFVAMFLDEGRLASRVQHPNVVATLDVVHDGTDLILVMEYIHGESLARLTRPRARDPVVVPAAIASAIICDVLDGLHAAHEATDARGMPLAIVHRDVSPQNVLVGVDGISRVADFGVAKAVGRLHTTHEGDIKGKLAYMAPEQFQGEAVDRRADIFAASTVLWEMLTGKRLFAGATEGEIVGRVLAGAITPPGRVAEGIPAALDEIVMHGLAPAPDERFATAHAMARAIEGAGAVARRAQVGEWVSTLAKDSLAGRTRLIAEIERATSPRDSEAARIVAAVSSADLSGELSDEPPPPAPPSHRPSDGGGTERSAAPVATLSRPGGSRSARRLAIVAAVAASVVAVSVAVTAGVLALRSPTRVAGPAPVATTTEPAPSTPASALAPGDAPPPSDAPATSSAPAQPAAPSAPPGPRPKPVAPARPPHSTATARPKSAPKPDCSDPCPFDDRGVKVCKVECLR